MTNRVVLSLVLLLAGFTLGLVVTGRTETASRPADESFEAAAPAEPGAAPAEPVAAAGEPGAAPQGQTSQVPLVAGAPDFTRVAARAVRAVVNISSVQVVRRPNSPFADDPFFRYFFGDDLFGWRDQRSASLGSGVVVSSDGYVVTNSHVVGENTGAREVTVALSDKREVPGTIIGTDPATDIAVLKVDGANLPTVPWGDSSRLQVGEWVLAIGSPFQLSQTVTAGIVSATGRANVGFAQYEDFIQTDAAINPGNSGGALINTRGELVGINTGIFSASGGYQGIGFAVPSLLARRVADDLIQYGEVRRGAISGILIEPLTPQIAEQLRSKRTRGVLVVRIATNSDAYAAGIRLWDIIARFNGEDIEDPSQLFRLVADTPIGSTARLAVERNGRTIDLQVPIVARSQQGRRVR
jgi:serine protease Do